MEVDEILTQVKKKLNTTLVCASMEALILILKSVKCLFLLKAQETHFYFYKMKIAGLFQQRTGYHSLYYDSFKWMPSHNKKASICLDKALYFRAFWHLASDF